MLSTDPFLELQSGLFSRGFKHPQSLLFFGRPFHACLLSCQLYLRRHRVKKSLLIISGLFVGLPNFVRLYYIE